MNEYLAYERQIRRHIIANPSGVAHALSEMLTSAQRAELLERIALPVGNEERIGLWAMIREYLTMAGGYTDDSPEVAFVDARIQELRE